MSKQARILGLLILVLSTGFAPAQSQGPPFLWEISGTKTSYLFGTVHLPDPRVVNLPASVNRAFEASQAVYTEIPLDPSSLMAQVPKLMLSGPRSLREILPSDLLQRTEKALQQINSALTIEAFLKFKVWTIATMVPILETQLENPGVLPMDARLYQQAQKHGKTVGSLETIQEQVQIFDSLSEQEQVRMLRDTLDFLDEHNAQGIDVTDQLIDWYVRGDLAEFGKLMVGYVREDAFYEAFVDKVLYQRNYLMADRIEALVKENSNRSHFFAVGAGHYWGETGIQNLLAEKGFEIRRVSN